MSHRVGLDQATVVEAAVKLIDEEGLDQLTLGRLAGRLGVRTPSLYNHIAGLPGLKHDLALYCLRDLLDRILRATVGISRAEAIFALADAYRAYAKEAPAYRLGEEEAIHAIRSLRSIVHGFLSLEVAGGFGMPVDLDASFHWLINLYIAGLSRSTATGEKGRSATGNETTTPA